MVRSWFNETTGKIDERKIDTSEFDSVHGDVLQMYKVRKQLRLTDKKTTSKTRLIYLLEDEFESEPKIRIVVPPSHRYQAMLAVHVQEHWGVQRTLQQVQKVFYWLGWRNDTSIFVTECAGCLHREKINLKDMGPTRSMHKTSLTFFVRSSCGTTSLRFIFSLCKQPAHSVTKIDVSFLQPDLLQCSLYSPVLLYMYC